MIFTHIVSTLIEDLNCMLRERERERGGERERESELLVLFLPYFLVIAIHVSPHVTIGMRFGSSVLEIYFTMCTEPALMKYM